MEKVNSQNSGKNVILFGGFFFVRCVDCVKIDVVCEVCSGSAVGREVARLFEKYE